MRIRDGKNSDPDRDKHPGSATLLALSITYLQFTGTQYELTKYRYRYECKSILSCTVGTCSFNQKSKVKFLSMVDKVPYLITVLILLFEKRRLKLICHNGSVVKVADPYS
jgi:hypothetical protein